MSLFDRTFLISTGVTAVICGALYYYLNAKIRDLEQALVKQNQVLSSFIANVQQEFRGMAMARANGGGSGANKNENGMTYEIVETSGELASPEAIAAVAEIDNKKIVITESECDSASEADASEADASEVDASDSDTDASDSDTDASEADASEADASEAGADTDIHDNKLIICDLSLNDMKIIDMTSLGISHLDIYTPERQSASEAEYSDSESESDSEEDGFHRVTKLVIGDINLNVLDLLNTTSKIEEIQVEEISAPTPVPVEVQVEAPAPTPVPTSVPTTSAPASKEILKYDDLKVDDLRKLVLDKGLAQKDEVKKLKKNELLSVLKKVQA